MDFDVSREDSSLSKPVPSIFLFLTAISNLLDFGCEYVEPNIELLLILSLVSVFVSFSFVIGLLNSIVCASFASSSDFGSNSIPSPLSIASCFNASIFFSLL